MGEDSAKGLMAGLTTWVKSWLESRPLDTAVAIQRADDEENALAIGPDGYAYQNNGVDAICHRMIDEWITRYPRAEMLYTVGSWLRGREIIDGVSPQQACRLLLVLADRAQTDIAVSKEVLGLPILKQSTTPVDARVSEQAARLIDSRAAFTRGEIEEGDFYNEKSFNAFVGLARELLQRDLPLSENELQALLDWHRTSIDSHFGWWAQDLRFCFFPALVRQLERYAGTMPLSKALQRGLIEIPRSAVPDNDLLMRCRLLSPTEFPLMATDVWTCQALDELDNLKEPVRMAWAALLNHCFTATASKPSKTWLRTAKNLLQDLGHDEFQRRLHTWLPLTDKPRQDVPRPHGWENVDECQLDPDNVDTLKGVVWCACLLSDAGLPGALRNLAISSYRKLPGCGPRVPKIGNAAIWALGNLPGLAGTGALAVLKTRITNVTAQKLIDAAFTEAAEREHLPREEIEELAVPGYGMEEVGLRTEQLGDFTAELRVTGGAQIELRWRTADGKSQKNVPAAAKSEHAEQIKELKQAAKDIQALLAAQKERLDRLFIQQKRWPYKEWRERYLDHPLVGILARRLIWCFERDGEYREGIYHPDTLRDRNGDALEMPEEGTLVSLWHPLNHPAAEVLAWRQWLEQEQFSQPMKQAHRELYLLTDAERATGIYSNRFAAHILKQHQFNALCRSRGWRNRLLVSMEQYYLEPQNAASRELPQWNLRAEYWIDGIGEFGTNTTDAGTFLHVATDQVRFYQQQASGDQENREPLPLEQVPPLVFSEIMRDVDLFVGVAGVGNDPAWIDGGAEGRYNDYWRGYAFGALNETAETRHDVLSRLLPRLKISSRCTLSERFLEVRGQLRTYKIHLGSGNILMTPNDQYLCIVLSRGSANEKIFLPFEGDDTLSLILSKAFLLAEDTKISDPTILNQIRG